MSLPVIRLNTGWAHASTGGMPGMDMMDMMTAAATKLAAVEALQNGMDQAGAVFQEDIQDSLPYFRT
ncbi:MAG: hypothetical protein ACOH2K_09715 [Burkholderiaceae bacterium]